MGFFKNLAIMRQDDRSMDDVEACAAQEDLIMDELVDALEEQFEEEEFIRLSSIRGGAKCD